jgi:hypothetical protein
MQVSGIARRSALLAALVLLPVLSGCGSNPFKPPIDLGGDGHIPGDTPENDSPQNLMIRFERSYEFQDLPKYELLLTSDFRYTFSAASDPGLVDLYPNWGRDDEVESSKHLFEGFVNSSGTSIPAASQIDMTLNGVLYNQTDFLHADSTSHYQKVVVTSVDMDIVVPQGASDPITYHISARHEFYIVRGDAAVLDPGQDASPNRWYIRRWDDLSPPPPALRLSAINGAATSGTPTTWGKLKDSFFH